MAVLASSGSIYGTAWAPEPLTQFDQQDNLFSRAITAIDMRLQDRLTVRLSEDAAKAREELLKVRAPKKKAGDA